MSKSKVTKSPVKGAPQTPTMIHKHIDNFLAKIVGETPVDDNPRDSTEYWLNEIAENLPGGGTEVIANPTLAGTEDTLIGLQVGDTKYKLDAGEKLYLHKITVQKNISGSIYTQNVYYKTTDAEPYATFNAFYLAVKRDYGGVAPDMIPASSPEVRVDASTSRLNMGLWLSAGSLGANFAYVNSQGTVTAIAYNTSFNDSIITI